MIYESSGYKDELLKVADRTEKRLLQKRWTAHSSFLLEKDIFFSFFAIRKLIEAKSKITNSSAEMLVTLNKHSTTDLKPTIRNNHKIDELYDLTKSNQITKPIHDVCGDIVHSYILAFDLQYYSTSKNSLNGVIYFTSFNNREKGLCSLKFSEFIRILKIFGKDYPSYFAYKYNPKTGDYDVSTEINANEIEEMKAIMAGEAWWQREA